MTARAIQRMAAAGTLVLALAADQVSKFLVLHRLGLGGHDRVVVAPFMDLVLVWNNGVSYGLLQQDNMTGRFLLVGFAFVVAAALVVWMWRTSRGLVALSLALIAGGAIGNGVDRLIYGAVVDFVYLHAYGFSWYVFNLGDVWIVAGVIGLLYDSARPHVELTDGQ